MAQKKRPSRASSKGTKGRTRVIGTRNVRSSRTARIVTEKKKLSHAPHKKDTLQSASRKLPSVRRKPSRIPARNTRMASGTKQKRIARTPKPAKPLDPNTRTRLKHALDLVRRHVKGYSAADGWSLRDLGRISGGRRKTLIKKAGVLRELLRQPHDVVKAPTRKARHNLVQFTRQKIRSAKHFIVHKPADNFKVRIRQGRVTVRGRFKRGRVLSESTFYLFPRAARGPEDAERLLRDMLPDMPPGYYVMLTGAHGDTGEPTDRESLRSHLMSYINAYQSATVNVYDAQGKLLVRKVADQGFAQAIVGYRFMATTLDGVEVQMAARDVRRQRSAEWNEKLKRRHMTERERTAYEAPRKKEAQRQARRKAARKGAAKRKSASKHK